MGAAPLSFLFGEMICYFKSLKAVCVGIHLRTIEVDLARVLMFSVSFFCVLPGSPDMRACRADSESVRKTAFLGLLFQRNGSIQQH